MGWIEAYADVVQLLEAERERIERLNWVLPSVHSPRGAWVHPEWRCRT